MKIKKNFKTDISGDSSEGLQAKHQESFESAKREAKSMGERIFWTVLLSGIDLD
jgi:hypothetical protein